jgi:GntR family transcriptional repressor for pyruvate dehydrogenase complex
VADALVTQTKISAPKISDVIAGTLERRILEGSLKPGDRLLPERELAVELGVSRPSLREAIQKLASRGLLASRQGGGTFVTRQLEASFVDPWQEMLRAHTGLREDLLEFRRLLGGQMAEWAAERRLEEDLLRLVEAFAALQAAVDGADPRAQLACERRFQQAIAEAAHNIFLGHQVAAVLRLLEEDLLLNLTELSESPRALTLLKTQHTALFEAIRDRNPAAARRAAEVHFDFIHESLAQSLRAAARRESAVRRLAAEAG